MGTRHLICCVIDGEYKVAQYGQWDGYPSGQGVRVLNFLKNRIDCGPFGTMELFKEKLRTITEISNDEIDETCRAVGIDPTERYITWDGAKKHSQNYPHLSRDTGAEILDIVYYSPLNMKLKTTLNFAADSLFCEWCYVIDFDKNTFEVYEGYNQTPLDTNERFYFLSHMSRDGFYPVKHLVTFDLFNLPLQEEFLRVCEKSSQGEE